MANPLLEFLDQCWNQSNIDHVLNISKSASEQLEKLLKNKLILEELQRPGVIRPGSHPDFADLAAACLAHKIKQMKETVETNKTDYMGFKVFTEDIEKKLKYFGMIAVEYTDYEELAKKREQVFEEMQKMGVVYAEIRNKIRSVPWPAQEDGIELRATQGFDDLVNDMIEFHKSADVAQRNFDEFVRSVMLPIKDAIKREEEERRAAQLFFKTSIITELVED